MGRLDSASTRRSTCSSAPFALVRGSRPDLRLRLVGSERATGDRARLEAMAEALGIAGAVDLAGWLDRAGVAAAMARAAVFVHPSPSETFGVAAAEAILTGLPVASRRSGGVPWIIELSGGFGRVAEADEPESFAPGDQRRARRVDSPSTRRPRELALVDAVGEAAVARRAIELYGLAPRPERGAIERPVAIAPLAAAAHRATSVATGHRRDGSRAGTPPRRRPAR